MFISQGFVRWRFSSATVPSTAGSSRLPTSIDALSFLRSVLMRITVLTFATFDAIKPTPFFYQVLPLLGKDGTPTSAYLGCLMALISAALLREVYPFHDKYDLSSRAFQCDLSWSPIARSSRTRSQLSRPMPCCSPTWLPFLSPRGLLRSYIPLFSRFLCKYFFM